MPRILARAKHELNMLGLLLYRRVAGMPQNEIWKLLTPIHESLIYCTKK
jgi:hypothetical protein